jgi:ABC-2 type transport system ATP-binding protein
VVALKVDDGAKIVLEVVRALDAAGIAPETLNVREPTLDDVFLSITGHGAEEETTEDEEPAAGRGRRQRTRGAA